MANVPPKEYVVYWTSKFNGKNNGYSTPMYKANSLTFADSEKAAAFYAKMEKLEATGGLYRGRIVCHLARCF